MSDTENGNYDQQRTKWERYEFNPNIEVPVPREVWERVITDLELGVDPEAVAPHEASEWDDRIDEEMLNYYHPTIRWTLESKSED